MHWPDPSTPISETLEALEQLIDQGKIKAAGVSNFSLEQLEEALKHLPIAVNQVPYSMVNRGIEEDVVPFCIKNNVGILAYSPMQRGLLTGKITTDYKFKPGDHRPSTPFFKKDNIESVNRFLNRIKPIANQHQATLAQVVLNWTMNQPGIASVLAGARNPQQVIDNAGADNFRLSNEEITLINNYLDDLKLDLS
jgi:aryl-alcohol dehydrogenase-like predicted oxidoreductase